MKIFGKTLEPVTVSDICIRKLIKPGRFVGLMLLSFLISDCASSRTDKEGYRQIFDGKTLSGWTGDPNYWRVENGCLVGEITPDKLLKQNSFIIWEGGQPSDFELKASVRITEEGNSGINYRSEKLAPFVLRGYQSDIDGKNRYTGQLYEERKRTTLAYRGEKVTTINPGSSSGEETWQSNVSHNAWKLREVTGKLEIEDRQQTKLVPGEWSEVYIVAKGNLIRHFVNGMLVSEVTDLDTVNRKSEGYVGVQVHVGPPMKVEYRNIRIKE